MLLELDTSTSGGRPDDYASLIEESIIEEIEESTES